MRTLPPEAILDFKKADAATIGARIKGLRLAMKVTQPTMAAGILASTAYVSRIESGQRRPAVAKLEQIADYLGVPPEYLVYGDDLSLIDLVYEFFLTARANPTREWEIRTMLHSRLDRMLDGDESAHR